jgi:polyisoprenoid-binding protein YceI
MKNLMRRGSLTRQEAPVISRKHRWWRWLGAAIASILIVAVAGPFIYFHLLATPTPAPLTLSKIDTATASTGNSSIDGMWTVGKGSRAGYRVQEQILWQGNTLVGRTSAVTGKLVIAHREISSASFDVDLTMIKTNGKALPQFAGILDTAGHPEATFTLTKPIVPGLDPGSNSVFEQKATGELTIHGTTRSVTIAIAGRHTGSELEEAGSIPIRFSTWNIHAPYGIQDHGIVEFLLVLHQ